MLETDVLKYEWGKPVAASDVRKKVAEKKYAAVTVVQPADSSSRAKNAICSITSRRYPGTSTGARPPSRVTQASCSVMAIPSSMEAG